MGLSLILPFFLLVCSWKLKVAASAQGCLVLLLLLLVHCSCSASAQPTPKPAWPPAQQIYHLVLGKDTCCPDLVGHLFKNVAKETAHLLWITVWTKSALCSYPELAIGK